MPKARAEVSRGVPFAGVAANVARALALAFAKWLPGVVYYILYGMIPCKCLANIKGGELSGDMVPRKIAEPVRSETKSV